MKNLLTVLVAIFSVAVLTAQEINDPNAELRQVTAFNGISVSDAFDVYLSQGNSEAVAVSASSVNERDKIVVEVKNGILHINLGKNWKWKSWNNKLRAYISFKDIDKLNISGACDVYINGVLKTDDLAIRQSGASDLKGAIDVEKLDVDLSGASDIKLTGKATQVKVESSGASGFKGYDLITEICEARASGASDIKITVNKEISAHASGASDVRYKGSGVTREVKSSGSSSVSKG